MARAKLINDLDHVRLYQIPSGAVIRLELNEEWTEMLFRDKHGTQLGEFYFNQLETGHYKLMRMYTNSIKQSGIGRAALEFFRDMINGDRSAVEKCIYASSLHEQPGDGSELTEEAPGFVNKMIAEGLIEANRHDVDYHDEDQF